MMSHGDDGHSHGAANIRVGGGGYVQGGGAHRLGCCQHGIIQSGHAVGFRHRLVDLAEHKGQ